MSIKPRLQLDEDVTASDPVILFKRYKRQCKSIASDFNYSKEIMDRIEKAETIPQLERIMVDGRRSL